jgi:hypothetical protein
MNYRSVLQNHVFTNTEQKYMMLLPFEREMFAVSYSDHYVRITIGTRVEPPQDCYIEQIPGHQLRSVGEATISLQHWFTLFLRDDNSDCRTIPNARFTVFNRHEFHYLATLPTQVMA